MLRRITLAAMAGIAVAVPAGCCTCCGYDPIVRQDQLLEKSEDVRQVDQPMHLGWDDQEKTKHLVPVRIHGGIE